MRRWFPASSASVGTPCPVDGQRHLIEGGESGLGPVEEGDAPPVHRNLDVPLELFPLKHELLESGAHEPPQLLQEFFHHPGIDPERGHPSRLPDRAEEPHFRHEEQGPRARV